MTVVLDSDAVVCVAILTGCTAYDAYYLVLARRKGALLATADKALSRRADAMGIKTHVVRSKPIQPPGA